MTNGEAINWIINISADIGKAEHRDLWHYEQALSEIREMLETVQPVGIDLFPNISEEYKKGYRDGLRDKSEFNAELTQINANQCVGSVEYDDVVSRQAAIDELTRFITPHDNGDGTMTIGVLSKSSITDILNNLPSAQSEPSQAARDIATILENEKDMRVIKKNAESESCADTISRKAAIDIVQGYAEQLQGYIGMPNDSEVYAYARRLLLSIDRNINALQSAQPEPLTDKEQRIFLSAMGREEEVCKEVDDAWRDCREPYEDSLVHVCNEIKRKVKGALWT